MNKWDISCNGSIYDTVTDEIIVYGDEIDVNTALHLVELHNKHIMETTLPEQGDYTEEGYIAGALFKDGDQKQRMKEKHKLTWEIPSVKWFNPLSDNPANDKSQLPTAKSIFEGDTDRIIASRYIFAELDGEDAGVMMELGVAWGIDYMLHRLEKILEEANKKVLNTDKSMEVANEVNKLLKEIPFKTVVAHLSDIRVGTSGEYDGKYVPFGLNQYILGGTEEIGRVYHNVDEAIEGIKKLINKHGK